MDVRLVTASLPSGRITRTTVDPRLTRYRGFFSTCQINLSNNMEVIATLTKKLDDRTSTWRFVKTPEGYCAIGGNYKLVSYRSQAAMEKSKQWFLAKGFTLA